MRVGLPDCREDIKLLIDGGEDGVDAFPLNATESADTDNDGIGNNADTDDDGDGYTDAEELADGSDPLDGDDTPNPGGLSIIILKAAIDAARAREIDDSFRQ